MKMTIDEVKNTASIDADIDGALEVWTKEVRDGDQIAMPNMLKLGIGLIIEAEPKPFPLRDIERVNRSVWDAFMTICKTERGLLAPPTIDTPAVHPGLIPPASHLERSGDAHFAARPTAGAKVANGMRANVGAAG